MNLTRMRGGQKGYYRAQGAGRGRLPRGSIRWRTADGRNGAAGALVGSARAEQGSVQCRRRGRSDVSKSGGSASALQQIPDAVPPNEPSDVRRASPLPRGVSTQPSPASDHPQRPGASRGHGAGEGDLPQAALMLVEQTLDARAITGAEGGSSHAASCEPELGSSAAASASASSTRRMPHMPCGTAHFSTPLR